MYYSTSEHIRQTLRDRESVLFMLLLESLLFYYSEKMSGMAVDYSLRPLMLGRYKSALTSDCRIDTRLSVIAVLFLYIPR